MNDLTSGSPLKKILLFSIPLFIGNVFQQLYSVVDLLIVGQKIGKNAVGAVGISGTIIFLIVGFSVGITSGLTIPTANYFGAKNMTKVRKSFATALYISLGISMLLSAVIPLFLQVILKSLHVPSELMSDAHAFILINVLGLVFIVIFNLLSNVLRALGNSKTPLYFLIIANLINGLLAYVFIVFLHFGVSGSAAATIISQICSVVFCMVYIYKKMPILSMKKEDFILDKDELKKHLSTGLPMGLQVVLIGLGNILLQVAINTIGTNAVVTYSIVGRVETFLFLPMMSIGITMATYNAQNNGAKQYERILIGMKKAMILCTQISFTGGILFFVLHKIIVLLFLPNANDDIIKLTLRYFEVTGPVYFLCGFIFIIRFGLQGLNKSKIATMAGIIELFGKFIAATLLAHSFGFTGVVFSNPLAWFMASALLFYGYIQMQKELLLNEI